jgi:hypothetical protein
MLPRLGLRLFSLAAGGIVGGHLLGTLILTVKKSSLLCSFTLHCGFQECNPNILQGRTV